MRYPFDAVEYDVRVEILSVIQNNVEVDFSNCDKIDFEFLDANGKNVSVPNLKPESTSNCRTLKRLAGNGAVYIRMCKDFEGIHGSPQWSRSPTLEPDTLGTPVESPELPSYMEYFQPAAPPPAPVLPMISVHSEAPAVPQSQLHPPDIDFTTDTTVPPGAHTLQETPSLPGGPALQEMPSLPRGPALQETPSLSRGLTLQERPSLPQGPTLQHTPSLPRTSTLQETPVSLSAFRDDCAF